MIYINEVNFIMLTVLPILVIVVAVLFIVFYNMYVSLLKKRNRVREAISGVDVQMTKRYDLIPNILTIANRFMEHEKSLLEEIAALRTRAVGVGSGAETISEKINLDNSIASKMGQLMVNVENYPQLKSDQTMTQAIATYTEVEEHIAAARRFYNSAVNELNNAVEIFPSSVIAGMLNINSYPFFEAPESAKKGVNASDYLYRK